MRGNKKVHQWFLPVLIGVFLLAGIFGFMAPTAAHAEEAAAPPDLTVGFTDTLLDSPIEVTFEDDPEWTTVIRAVYVTGKNTAELAESEYAITPGKITIEEDVFTEPKDDQSYDIVIKAEGYADAQANLPWPGIPVDGVGTFSSGPTIEITGKGVENPTTFDLSEWIDHPDAWVEARVYSTINTWPTKKWYVAEGVKLKALLKEAGIKDEAKLIKVKATDGYVMTFTRKELLEDNRYYFPNLKENHEYWGQVPGSLEGAEPVDAIIALSSVENSDNPDYITPLDCPLLVLGQRGVTEQTNHTFVKNVSKIEVLDEDPLKWAVPEATPAPPEDGIVDWGTEVELTNEFNDADKIYYTLDSSAPTFKSPMYNWIASRWWSSRENDLDDINHPIVINEDTTIKAVTIGFGREDSDIVTFEYLVPSMTPTFSLGTETEVNNARTSLDINDREEINGSGTTVDEYDTFVSEETITLQKDNKYYLGLKVTMAEPALNIPIQFRIDATAGVDYYLKDTAGTWYKKPQVWGPGTTQVNNENYYAGVTSPVFVEIPADFEGSEVQITISMHETADPDNVFGIQTFKFEVIELVDVTGVSIPESDQKLKVGETAQLDAVVEPENATDKSVTWSSNNEEVATVDETGLVAAVAEGTATITVTTEDGEFTDSITVTVTEEPNMIVSPSEVRVSADFSKEFELTVINDTINRAVYNDDIELQGVFENLGIKNVTKTSDTTVTAEVYGNLEETGTGKIVLAGDVLKVSESPLTVSVTVKTSGNGSPGPGEEVVLTITGDGVTTSKEFTQSQLEKMKQYQEVYSCINTWPTKKWYVGKGVSLRELLDEAGMKPGARQVKFIASDGYYMTLTVQELLGDKRYYFPNFKEGGGDADGHIRGSTSGAREVKTILGLISAEGTDNSSYMNEINTLLLMLGQRAVTEQTGPLFVKNVKEIEVLTSAPGRWNKPTADPKPGTVPAGTEVELHSTGDDDDKVHYTLDGSTPTIESPIYNWIAKRWWSSRGADAVAKINHPIKLTKDTTIKAITIGPGKSNSSIAEFNYNVTGTTRSTSEEVDPDEDNTVKLEDKVELEIPAGALTGTDVEVKIERVTEPPAAPAGFKILGDVYEFRVDDETSYSFNKAVTITFSFNPDELSPGEIPAVHYYDETKQKWTNLGGEVSGNTITVEIDHFTKFAVMAATEEVEEVTLTDISGHWAENTIKKLVDFGAISGYPDGTFRPDKGITRAEFLTILVKAFELEPQSGKIFTDTAGHWAQNTIATAVYHGIASGYNADTFGPDDPITREQMAAMVVNAAELTPVTEETTFKDSSIISEWAQTSVATAVHHGIINGYPDNTVRPQGNATRAEAATVVINILLQLGVLTE